MFPSFLISLREVIEATAIIATLLGVISQLKWKNAVHIVWYATGAAAFLSMILIGMGTLLGFNLQNIYSGKVEQLTEGVLMIISAFFITWAVFFLHSFFSKQKKTLLYNIQKTTDRKELKRLFFLVFTAVFREGFEIALFLTSIYLSTNPKDILVGFLGGIFGGLILSYFLFKTTERLPMLYALRISSIFLILFAAGLIARSIHEFVEAGMIPELYKLTLFLIPEKGTVIGDIMLSLFGLSKKMDILQLLAYILYFFGTSWFVFSPTPLRLFSRKETDENKDSSRR